MAHLDFPDLIGWLITAAKENCEANSIIAEYLDRSALFMEIEAEALPSDETRERTYLMQTADRFRAEAQEVRRR